MKDCIFCKIIAGEVPSEKVHHDNKKAVSFPSIHPARPGHMLVVPTEHHRWFWEMPDDIANDLFKTARELAKDLKEKMKTDYVQLSIVGKEVPHVHLHLIPRMLTDHEAIT